MPDIETTGDGKSGNGAAGSDQNGGAGQAGNNQNKDGSAGGAGDDLQALLAAERSKAAKLEQQLSQIKADSDKAKAAALKAGDQTKYLEQLESENAELKQQTESIKLNTIRSLKMEKLKGEAQRQGLKPSAVEAFERLVNLDDLQHGEMSDGRIVISKADDFMKGFKQKHDFLFGTAGDMNVNAGGGRNGGSGNAGSSGDISLADVEALKSKPAEYREKLRQWMVQQKHKRAGKSA